MSRPANGNVYAITKLPNRKSVNEEKEAMNCKSCRKRKIKCSRTRPKCNSCDVFHCECIYDAVPRKRGPKTELLEDLLRRIGHLEKKLEDGKSSDGDKSSEEPTGPGESNGDTSGALITPTSATASSFPQKEEIGPKQEEDAPAPEPEPQELAPTPISLDMDANYVPHLVDVYFNRVNKKPYSYIHEKTFKARLQEASIPQHLLNAVCAIAIRYTLPPPGKTLAECTERFANLARSQVDADEPSIDNLLTLILLSDVFFALGHGKKSFMQLGSAIRMALALELHRELSSDSPATPVEREVRRRCFWTCYLMDRFAVCGSNRPPLISDCTIKLRLPCSESYFKSGKPSEESYFSEDGFGQSYGSIPVTRNTHAMLVEIVRILGKTVLYIQQGGVKGDSHFPWHSSSNLSMIRNELKVWAGYFENKAQEKASFLSGSEATVFYLSKAVYHLIHSLMYRTFLPIDIKEINGQGTQQAWQQEATNMCSQHAKALTDLAQQAANTPSIEWPAFMSYCLTSAATVHVHCTQYAEHALSEGSRDYLLRVIKFLIRMRRQWAIINHQCSTIRRIYMNHIRISKGSPSDMKHLMHQDDFFDRYEDVTFDTAFIPFEFLNDFSVENLASPDDLFADPTLLEIFNSPVPSVTTPQIPNASPSNTTDGGSASSITHDEYGNPRPAKRTKTHRNSSASETTPINHQHSPNNPYHIQGPRTSNGRFFYPGHQPISSRNPTSISIPEHSPFNFPSPAVPPSAYGYDMQYGFSPSDPFFNSSNPYNHFLEFGMDPGVFSGESAIMQEKDSLPTELEPDPLMAMLLETGREDGNGLDMFMGNSASSAN